MALVDLTNVNPYAGQVEAQRRLNETNAKVWGNLTNQISQGIQAGIARRNALEERNRAQRDREYALAAEATGKLVQAKTGTKYTDMQLQQVGRQFKQEYYDAVKTYENSDKGDEARAAFEEAKQTSLGSARTIGASIDQLGTAMDAFKEQARVEGISDAVNPSIRQFFADLNDPETPADQYQIIKDPETGQLKYQGTTSEGQPVDFFLDDLANGENSFAPQAKPDMPSVIMNLTKGLDAAVKQEKRDNGVVEVTDWNSVDQALTSRINTLFDDDTNFRQMASGLGYGFEEVESVLAGEPVSVDPDGPGGNEPYEVSSIEDLKKAMAEELKMQVESTTAHKEKWVVGDDPNTAEAREFQRQQIETQAVNTVTQTNSAILANDFSAYENKPATMKGLKGNIAKVETLPSGKVQITIRSGQKGGAKQAFEPNDPQLYAILNGVDYATAAAGVGKLNQINAAAAELEL